MVVSELSDRELLAAAREAVAERLVEELGPGRFGFAHALVRDTLYQELSPGLRSRLHERIGVALEQLHGDDSAHLDELAHHFLAATPRGDSDRAIAYAERAAAQAMAKLAYEEASELYERALEVMELDDEVDEERRCRLLLALGVAHTSASCVADARDAFQRAAGSARARDDAEALSNATLGLSALGEAGRIDEELIALIEEALEAIGDRDQGRRAALLSALGQELYWVDPQERSRPVIEEAIEIARRIGDDRVLARALHRAVFLPIGPNAGEERLAIADEMIELGRRLDDRETLMLGHAYRVREFLERGDLPSLDRELEAYARLAEQLRMPHHEWHTPALRAMRAIIDGDLEQAERLAEEARAGGERAEQALAAQFYGVQLISLRRLQGRAEELLPTIRSLSERYPQIPAWRTARASLAALSGDREEAVLELERLSADRFAAIPRDINRLPAMALMGEAAALVGDEQLAAALYDELAPYDGHILVIGRAASSNGPVSRVLGLLAWAQRRLEQAEAHLESAVESSRRMGDRPFTALGRAELARVLLARGGGERRSRALELLSQSLSAAREMGARGVADLALQLRLEAQGLSEVDVTTSIDEVVSALESERPDLRAHAAPDGTVAILFSDIEDSTVLTERLGDERWLEVLREHNTVFRRHLARHDGYEVKSQGDGFMLAFPDPCEALRCAAEVQRAFAEREREGSEEALRVRIGLHTGEVIAEEGDFFGKNVILAARIAAQANGSEILVSESMRESVGETDGIGFDDGRELELKGLAGRHRVYRAEWSAEPETAAAP
jgi:class 3 adenylate cyclase